MRSAVFVRLEQGDEDAACAALALVLGEEFSDDAGVSDRRRLVERDRGSVGPPDHCRSLAERLAPSPAFTSRPGVSIWAPSIASLQCSTTACAITTSPTGCSPLQWPSTRISVHRRGLREHGSTGPSRSCIVGKSIAPDMCVDAARSSIGDLDLPDNQRRLDDLTFRLDAVV